MWTDRRINAVTHCEKLYDHVCIVCKKLRHPEIGVNSVFSWLVSIEHAPLCLHHDIVYHATYVTLVYFLCVVKTVFIQNLNIMQKSNGRREQSKLQRWCFVSHLSPFYIFCQESESGPIFILIPKKIKSSQSQPSSLTESENDDSGILCFLTTWEDINKAVKIAKNLLPRQDYDENAMTAHHQSEVGIISI
jgi:hypothetical protein